MTCKVLIPIYRRPTPDEARAMSHNRKVLEAWPHAIVAPEDLDLEGIEQICPDAEILRVSDEWLGPRNGIAGYNKMMLDFYKDSQPGRFESIEGIDTLRFLDYGFQAP